MPVKATDKVFSLRLPINIYEILEVEAKKEKRSVNAEILIAIEKHIADIDKKRPSWDKC
jgi:hypothetical protein